MIALPRTPSFNLKGKSALVTGGSRGIGLGCSMALAEAGARVLLVARTKEEVKNAAVSMQKAGLIAEG